MLDVVLDARRCAPVFVRRSLAAFLLVASVAGCSGDATSVSPESAVREYVAALDAGDFDRAMSVRCASFRIDAALQDQFTDEVARIKAAAGGRLDVAELREVNPVRMLDEAGEPVEHEFEVRLETSEGTSSPLAIATATEHGRARVCGWTVPESFPVQKQLEGLQIIPADVTVDDVQALATDAVDALDVSVADGAASKGSGRQGIEGWTTAWCSGDFGGGRVTVVRYESPEAAAEQAKAVLATFAADSVGMFDVPPSRAGVGLRYRGSAWTGVQPADLGPQIDVMVVVYGDVLVWMTVSGLDPASDHTAIAYVAGQVASLVEQ